MEVLNVSVVFLLLFGSSQCQLPELPDIGAIVTTCMGFENNSTSFQTNQVAMHALSMLTPLLDPSKTLLNPDEVNYIRKVVKMADISKTPLGQLLDNGGKMPSMVGGLDNMEDLMKNIQNYISIRKRGQHRMAKMAGYSSSANLTEWEYCSVDYKASYPVSMSIYL